MPNPNEICPIPERIESNPGLDALHAHLESISTRRRPDPTLLCEATVPMLISQLLQCMTPEILSVYEEELQILHDAIVYRNWKYNSHPAFRRSTSALGKGLRAIQAAMGIPAHCAHCDERHEDGEVFCGICGEHHAPDGVPFACETGDGI